MRSLTLKLFQEPFHNDQSIVKSFSTSLLDSDFNNSQINYNNPSSAGFDNARNIGVCLVQYPLECNLDIRRLIAAKSL
jgi:hypothetical protein